MRCLLKLAAAAAIIIAAVLLVILLCRGCALSKDNYTHSHYIIRDLCERPSVQMLSPHKEWQVALQRAQAIRPLTASSSSADDFNLDALLDADNRRRLTNVQKTTLCRCCMTLESLNCSQVSSSAAQRQREDEAVLQRMHATTVRLDTMMQGNTSAAVALRKAQTAYVKRWKEQSMEYSEVVAAWNVARSAAANVTTDLTSVSFTSNSSNLMSRRSPAKQTSASQRLSGSAGGAPQRLSQDDSTLSAVAATATPAHARSSASRTEVSPINVDKVNPSLRYFCAC